MLLAVPPASPPAPGPMTIEVPFATLAFAEQGSAARLEVTMGEGAVTDEGLEQVLAKLRSILRNLASRPFMILVIRSDARQAALGVSGVAKGRIYSGGWSASSEVRGRCWSGFVS